MKNLLISLSLALAALCAQPVQAQEQAAASDIPVREHRAIWMSPYLGNNWPSSSITTANAASHQRILRNQLAKFKAHNINVLYYHVRSMCDANYNSAYEPWGANVSGTRGVAPAFDPFQFLIDEAHALGIEVYAWVNPYRYSSKPLTNPYGEGELNYENSHPEWLLVNSTQTVLNPGIEAVKQRVVDVAKDIVSKYDVDGMIFDDYFYGQGGTTMDKDADLYKAYSDAGGELSQADWRRANVNEMVQRVHDAIKELKPWCAFGISPAGVASPTNVQSEYGLPAFVGASDWQYNQIYSDPLAWLKAGTIDFISPQIYWPNLYTSLNQWWVNATNKFGRHNYASIDLSGLSTHKTAEFIRELESARQAAPAGQSGIVYFEYGPYVNYYERLFNNKNLTFGENMMMGAYPTKALTPLRAWDAAQPAAMVSNVAISGSTLQWNAVDGVRYTIYAHPLAENTPFSCNHEDLYAISYTNSMELPADAANYDWYVAVYDRYGNEFSPLKAGATAQAGTAPKLTYPANGTAPVEMFSFSWEAAQPGKAVVELSKDAAFSTVLSRTTAETNTLPVSALAKLEAGQTYYWRVRHYGVNATEAVSDAASFTAPRLAITSPVANATDVAVNPQIAWSAAIAGTEYTLELSTVETFNSLVYSTTTEATNVTIPARTLMTGRKYFARVTAVNGAQSVTSDVASFTTANKTDYAAPVFTVPATDGATLYANQTITVQPWEGMNNVVVNISTSSSFPSRTSFNSTFSDFSNTMDRPAGEIKLSSKNLVAGTTYYLRARGSYYTAGAASLSYTDYTTMTFVYSDQAGVDDITVDAADAEPVYYNLQGVRVDNPVPGLYLVRRGAKVAKELVQ